MFILLAQGLPAALPHRLFSYFENVWSTSQSQSSRRLSTVQLRRFYCVVMLNSSTKACTLKTYNSEWQFQWYRRLNSEVTSIRSKHLLFENLQFWATNIFVCLSRNKYQMFIVWKYTVLSDENHCLFSQVTDIKCSSSCTMLHPCSGGCTGLTLFCTRTAFDLFIGAVSVWGDQQKCVSLSAENNIFLTVCQRRAETIFFSVCQKCLETIMFII